MRDIFFLECKVKQAKTRENSIRNVKVLFGPMTTVFSEEEDILVT